MTLSRFFLASFLLSRIHIPATPDGDFASLNSAEQLLSTSSCFSSRVDTTGSDSLKFRIASIRKNFDRINAIQKWTAVKSKDIYESTEGGIAKFFYLDKNLEKIVETDYGETYQHITEYYLLNDQLSFAFEKHLAYNRPIYYDSIAMKANGDTEIFDRNKSIITEARNYFNAGSLIRRLSTDKEMQGLTKQSMRIEANRIKAKFKKLLDLSRTK